MVARHYPPGGAPQKTPAEYLRDLDELLKTVRLEKSAFSAATISGGFSHSLRPDGFDLTYDRYLSILSQQTQRVTTRCDFTDIGEISIAEYSTRGGRSPLYCHEIPLGPRCGGLGLFSSTNEALMPLAQTLLMLQQANGKAPQGRPQPAATTSQGI